MNYNNDNNFYQPDPQQTGSMDYNSNTQQTQQDSTYVQYNYNQQSVPVETVSGQKVLVFGIIAAATSTIGVPGIVFGSIGKKFANTFASQHGGSIFKLAKVGNILSKVGFGVGIGYTAFWTVYTLILIMIGLLR